jgi:hypothetical protein
LIGTINTECRKWRLQSKWPFCYISHNLRHDGASVADQLDRIWAWLSPALQ